MSGRVEPEKGLTSCERLGEVRDSATERMIDETEVSSRKPEGLARGSTAWRPLVPLQKLSDRPIAARRVAPHSGPQAPEGGRMPRRKRGSGEDEEVTYVQVR